MRFFERQLSPYPLAPLELSPFEDQAGKGWHALITFLWQCSKGLRGWLGLLVALTVALGLMEAYLFRVLGQVIDWVGAGNFLFWQKNPLQIGAMVAVVVLTPVVVWIHGLIKFQVLQGNFPMRLRWQFHRLMLGQSLAFYQDEFAGRVSAKVMQTALAVRDALLMMSSILVYLLVYMLTAMVVMASFDGWLMLPFLAWLLAYLSCVAYFIPRLKETASLQADARALMTGRITDAYANISLVKLFAHHRREERYARQAMKGFLSSVYGQMRLVTKFEVVNDALNSMLLLSLGVLAVWQWQAQISGAGALAAGLALALRLQGLSHWMMWEVSGLFENLGTVQDGMKTLSTPHSIRDKAGAQPLRLGQGDIVFDNIVFSYPNGKMVLEDFQLHIRGGEKIGVVGRSGAGKSTLVNLLLRFYDVNSGAIRFDGQSIADLTQTSLREHIAMVTQDASLLHRTVRENIAYGRPSASEAEIIEAAQQAHAWDFIQSLRDQEGRSGLDVHVGERGLKLSGGQRQRIAMARVFLKNAPILILDEATSALDSEVEAAIQESLDALMKGKTVIAIAHRLSTIARMDRLVVVDGGKIMEMGSHSELLASGGIYAQLWRRQTGGYIN